MIRPVKGIGAGVLLALVAALVPASSRPAMPLTKASPVAAAIPPAVTETIRQAAASGRDYVELELQAASPAYLERLRQTIAGAGGQVMAQEHVYITARVPAAEAERIHRSGSVVAVGVNEQLALDPPRAAAPNQALELNAAAGQTAVSLDPLGVREFRTRFGSQGAGVTVAVIDSGIDSGHAALARTPDGARKIVDWKDFTGEGYVETPHEVPWGASFTAPGNRRFFLPRRPDSSRSARFGYWDEFGIAGPYINRDLDRNGLQGDRFGVLLVDSVRTGQYDTVYVDTNNDGDFTDEAPLKLFQDSGDVGHMGRYRDNRVDRQVSFVVADLDVVGKFVSLGFDGYGHGTQVAGVLGAYNAETGFTGVAPAVRVMALKALGSTGAGDWFAIKRAIRYAAQNGASVINVSIGGLAAAASKFDSTASEWLNQIARDYGVLIVLAADNSGPGLSSGATLGNPSEVMAVGAYYSPDMWKRDFGVVVPHESIWALSGMGPRSDGSYVPSVVAPGGSPSPSPYWIHPTGYTTAVGTSIATPHVSGVAALLMEAGRNWGVNNDWTSVKRAMEMGARQIPGFDVFEQGHGLVSPIVAFGHLQQISSVPALKARTGEGNGGLLARSFTPGSAAFWLTNLDNELTRVGVYSRDSWVTPAFTSLTLPPGVARQLPLQLSPPQSHGVHSAFLTVTHPNKYGPSLSVPVTYVRPIALTNSPYATEHSLEVGRYQRFFFGVKPGTQSLNVTARVRLGERNEVQGTVQVHVFRPDGQAVYTSKIGAEEGTSLTAIINTTDPVAGVWEVVVTALPDSHGSILNAAYTLEVQAQPGPLPNQPLKFSVPAGSTTAIPVKLVNPFGTFTGGLEAIGLSRLDETGWNTGRPWRVEKGSQNVVEEFTLREFASRLRVEIGNPIPVDVDLNLHLYYLDPQEGWQLRGQSLIKGSSQEVIEVTNLPAGRYQVLAIANGTVPQGLQYQYRRLMAVEGYHIKVDTPPTRHNRNDSWTTNLTLTAPATPGRYVGQLLLRDTDRNQTLGWFPIEVAVGQPAISVEPMVAQLTRDKPSQVVLEVRDTRTGRIADATLTVNGQRFVSRNGQVAVTVTPRSATYTLEIEADERAYQPVRKQVTLPVKEWWGVYPLGVNLTEEFGAWRRKVMTQMP